MAEQTQITIAEFAQLIQGTQASKMGSISGYFPCLWMQLLKVKGQDRYHARLGGINQQYMYVRDVDMPRAYQAALSYGVEIRT